MLEAEVVGIEKLQNIVKYVENFKNEPLSKTAEKKILNKIGTAWVGLVKSNIANGVDYNKNPLLEPSRRDGQPLLDTGRLVSSINSIVRQDTLSIGTPVFYSQWLNDGTAKMRARPFLPTEEKDIPSQWWAVANDITLEIAIDDIADNITKK